MSVAFETSDKTQALQEPSPIASQATGFWRNLGPFQQVEDEEAPICTLEELLRRAPFSPGKQAAADPALRLRLASVDSNYNSSASPRSATPVSHNDDPIFSPNRPLSPQTDPTSSPRSGSSPQNTLTEQDSLSSSPRHFNHDTSSEPGNDQASFSPPESRRALFRSTNSACRPTINLGGNGPLKASSGSSPFREMTRNTKRFTRTRSNPDNELSGEAAAVCQKLAF